MNHIVTIKNRLVNYHFLYIVISLEFIFMSATSGQTILKDSVINGNNFKKAAFSLWF
jgi:hypothetical protein